MSFDEDKGKESMRKIVMIMKKEMVRVNKLFDNSVLNFKSCKYCHSRASQQGGDDDDDDDNGGRWL